MRRLVCFVVLIFGLSVSIPSNVVSSGGGFPLSWLWSWKASWPAAWGAEVVGLPAQARGLGDPTEHYVPGEVTKANRGAGRVPDRVKGGLPGYQPFEPRVLHPTEAGLLKANTASVAPQVDVRYPPNDWSSTTLTPQLMARGHDPDSSPNTGLTYRFAVYDGDGADLITESGWTASTTWTVPAGELEWSETYLYTVQMYDNAGYSQESAAFAFHTPIPQPALTSQLSQNEEKGFEPGIGNYTTAATDATIDTVGPPLAVTRSYNSLDMRTRQALGRGWSSIVDSRATETKNAAGALQTIVITYPDGQDVAFGRAADGTYLPPSGRFATMTSTSANGAITGYTVADKDATVYRFANSAGGGVFRISSITDANGRALSFTYNADGTPSRMQSASGRSLHFKWATPAGGNYPHIVEVATDPVTPGDWSTAKTWQYTYDNDRLVKVCAPTSWTYCATYEYSWISQYPNAMLNEAPFSYWRLNEAPGATVAVSGVEANSGVDNALYNNVTLGQPSALEGSASPSAGFNGTSSYVQLPGKLVSEGSYQAVSMWFKTTTTGGVLFSYNQDPLGNGTTPGNYTPALYVGSDGRLRGQFWQGDAFHPMTSTAAVNDGLWHHVVLSGSGNSQTLFVDGYPQGSLAGDIRQIPNGASNVYIGAGFVGGAWPGHPKTGVHPAQAVYFNGSISDVAFFDRPLSSASAYDLFNIGKWPRSALTKIVRPSGGVTAQVAYDGVTGKVSAVTDEDGGLWTIGKPSLAGNSNVYVASMLGSRPADYWRLGDAPGNVDAGNEVAGGRAAYVGGVTLGTPGPFADSKAVKLNGTSSYVELSGRNVPTVGPNSISLWFNMPAGSTAGGVLYSYQEMPMDNLSAGSSWTPALYLGTDGKLRGGLWAGSVSNAMTVATAVNDGKWHHVVLTAGANNQVLYLDGVQVCSSNATISTTTGTRAYVGAGKWAGEWPSHGSLDAGYFPGAIAEFAYLNKKLTAEQVSAQFKAATQTTPIAITKVASSVTAIPMPVSTVEVTDPGGRKLSYSYDVLNGHRAVAQKDALGNMSKIGYDVGGYSNLVFDPIGTWTENVSDARGNTVQSITCQNHAANKCSSVYYTYFPDATTAVLTPDPRNDVMLSMRDGRSASATDNTYLTSYTYDAKGNQTEVSEPLGRKTVTSYTDGTTVAAADGGFAPAGLPAKVVAPSGAVETFTYFKSGDVARAADANGKVTAYTYDGLGRTLTETEYTKTFPSGIVTSFTYDAVGRVLTQADQPVTNRVTGAVHTSATRTTYNVDGLVIQQEVADTTGGDAPRIVRTAYNAYGQIESETDATGAVTRFSYNSYGQMATETEPDGEVTVNSYDAEGNLLTVTVAGFTGDPNNPSPARDLVTSSKAYDPAGRLAAETDAMGWTTRYTYTDNGLTAKVTRTDGTDSFVLEDNTYDAAGNLTSRVTNNGTTVTAYTYDAGGRRISETLDPNGLKRTTTYQYSKDDNVLSEQDTDAAGNVVGLTQRMYDPEGHVVGETEYRTTGTVPIGRWKLNGNATDSAGNGPLAVTGTVTWTTGRGGAASFDGSSHLTSPGPVLDTANSFTVAAWVYLTDGSGYRRAVSANANRQSAFDLRYQQNTGRWMFNMHRSDSDSAPATQLSSTSPAALSTWTHLAGVYDAATGTMNLYVNGSLECTGVTTTPFTATGPAMIGAGWWNGALTDRWKGEISDVQFYQKVLTSAEIGQIKAGTAPAADATVIRKSSNLDDDGQVLSAVDPRGNVTGYVYDEEGRVTQIVGPAVQAESNGAAPVTARPVTSLGYDTFDGVTERRDPTGDVTVTRYDAAGNVTSTTLPSYTPPGSSTPITATATATYDPLGQLKTATDPLGNVTTFSYDQLGHRSKEVAADGGVTRYTHDLNGNRLSVIDPVGAVTAATYDYLGRPVTMSEVERVPVSAVHTTSYTYSPAGRVIQERSPTGVTTHATYNADGELLTSTDGSGSVTSYTYDGGGRIVKVTKPDGTYTVNAFDLADRVLSTKFYAANGTLLTGESSVYDASGQVTATTDGRGTTVTFTYDSTGLLTAQTEPISATDSIVTGFGYDLEGKPTRFTDGRGNRFITTYNTWGLPESVIEPATAAHPNASDRTFAVSYDAAGRIATSTQPGGIVITNTYNQMGDLIRRTGTGAEVATADRIFGYDPAGRMTSMSGPGGTNTLAYSDRDLLTSVSGPSGNSTYVYNGAAQLASVTDAAGTTAFGYDGAGRLSTVDNPGTGVRAAYTYNTMSEVSKIVYGDNGNSRSLTYDGMQRLTLDELKTPAGTVIGKIAYGWDANNNEISKTTTGFAGAAANTYAYDLADRLTSWNNGSTAVGYLYDKSGNRTQNGTLAFTYDERNRLRSGEGATYTYTPRGTLRNTVVGGVPLETQADAFGQILKQYYSATQASEYTYDGLGRVIRPGFAYTGLGNDLASDGQALYTRDDDGDLLGEAVGGDRRLAWTDLHADVVGQFTATGTALPGSKAYDPLGRVLATSGMIGNLGYQSEWTDAQTGRVNMHARWYNPATGQFDTRDSWSNSPVPNSVNSNRYQYGDGNPLTVTDPSGHFGCCKFIKKIAKAVAAPFRSAVSRVANTVKAGVSEAGQRALALRDKVKRVAKTVVNKVKKAASTVKRTYHRAITYVKKKYTAAKNYVKKKFNAAKRYVKKKVDKARKFIAKTAGKIRHAVKNVVKKAKQAAKHVMEKAKRVGKAVTTKVKDASKATVKWVKEHKAEVAGFVVGAVVGVGCGAAIGWTGVGAVACGAVAGAAGSLVTGAMKGHTGWKLVGDGLVGGVAGALTGGLTSVAGQGIRAGMGALSSGVKSAGKAALSGARGEIANIAGGLLNKSGNAVNRLGTAVKNLVKPTCHSFAPATRVKMADGTTKAIAEVKVGDKVAATDRTSGVTAAKPVVALHRNRDTDLTDVTVRNISTGMVSTLQTTAHHPFWSDEKWQWVNAADLTAGAKLRTAGGATVVVDRVKSRTGEQEMRDLTVAGVHTYYVFADSTPILVHNVDAACPIHGEPIVRDLTARCTCPPESTQPIPRSVFDAANEGDDAARRTLAERLGSSYSRNNEARVGVAKDPHELFDGGSPYQPNRSNRASGSKFGRVGEWFGRWWDQWAS